MAVDPPGQPLKALVDTTLLQPIPGRCGADRLNLAGSAA